MKKTAHVRAIFLTRSPAGATVFMVKASHKPEHDRRKLFERAGEALDKLAKQAHKEMRLKERAKWWAQHPERHPNK